MSQHPRRALVVEDQQLWRELFFGDALRELGFTVFPAATKEEALELLDAHSFDIAIVDINLTEVPGNSDGLIVTDYIEFKELRLPVIIVSGSDNGLLRLGNQKPFIVAKIKKDAFDLDEFVTYVKTAVH